MEKHLGIVRKFQQSSMMYGIDLLRRVQFDKQVRLLAGEKDILPLNIFTQFRHVLPWTKKEPCARENIVQSCSIRSDTAGQSQRAYIYTTFRRTDRS